MRDKTHLLSFDAAPKGQDTSRYRHIFDYGRALFAEDHSFFVQNGAGMPIALWICDRIRHPAESQV